MYSPVDVAYQLHQLRKVRFTFLVPVLMEPLDIYELLLPQRSDGGIVIRHQPLQRGKGGPVLLEELLNQLRRERVLANVGRECLVALDPEISTVESELHSLNDIAAECRQDS